MASFFDPYNTTLTPRLKRPAGLIVSIITLPIGLLAFMFPGFLVGNIIFELSCRWFPGWATIDIEPGPTRPGGASMELCDFPTPLHLAFLLPALITLYTIAHLWWVRRLPLRSHLLLMVAMVVLTLLLIIMPDGWIDWLKLSQSSLKED